MPRRIVADNGEYMLQNKGDLALLTVTVQRLLERWPDACVGVLTFEPRMLHAYAPRAEPLTFGRGGRWPEPDWFDSVAKRAGPALVSPTIGMRRRVSALMRQPSRLIRHAAPAAGEERSSDRVVEPDYAAQPVPAAIEDADLVVAIGGGYMADVDRAQAHRTLNLLERAADRGVPTAMLGQGLGPLEDPRLTARASAVLPRVDVIAVREARVGPSLLERWGVAPDRVVVTGDDAIELAHRAAPIRLGRGIGVCLRTTGYAPVAGHAREELRDALHASGRDLGAALVPFAISEYEAEDRRATLPLVEGYPDVARPLSRFASADDVARQVATCRVIVTGAYHLAVFALSEGIPVVTLSASRYSEDKMRGLGEQFGSGLTVVELDEHGVDARLRAAIASAWRDAPSLRPDLKEAARRQIAASRAAYERVFSLVR